MTSITDPMVLRRVPVDSIPRDCVHIPAVRVEQGWSVEIEGRWFRVVAEPLLLGDSLDEDGGRVQLLITGPGVSVVDLATFRRGERVWARAPQPGAIETLGCINPECPAPGPYELTEAGLMCKAHLADHALAETTGPDNDQEADRG
jgi:hypothetical protein